MKIEFKTFKGKKYYEFNDDRIICSYSVLFNRILISTGFFRILNNDEARFMFAHEERHQQDRNFYLFIFSYVAINLILTFLISLIIFFLKEYFELLIIFLLLTIISLIIFIIFIRLMEYRADMYASKKVDYKHFITAMRKIKNAKYSYFEKIFIKFMHPSFENRLEKLLNLKNK